MNPFSRSLETLVETEPVIPSEEIENVNIQFTEGQTPDNSDQ